MILVWVLGICPGRPGLYDLDVWVNGRVAIAKDPTQNAKSTENVFAVEAELRTARTEIEQLRKDIEELREDKTQLREENDKLREEAPNMFLPVSV